jgi:23S rRNA pseudouridine1911/1915/1917 synthase
MKRKVYLAIVDGEFNQEGFHRQNFASFGAKGEKQVLSNSVDAQVAESEIYFLEKVGTNQSLVMVILKTGIRHQIRAQLSSLGFPILGDTLYGGPEAPRLFLHSWLYEWEITVEDRRAELFSDFLDLDRAFKMASDKLRILERR